MTLFAKLLTPVDLQIIEPSPGFAALKPEHEPYLLTKTYRAHPCTLKITLLLEKAPNQSEIPKMVQKMDRIHDFYCGQAVGFVNVVKKIMKDEIDPFNPSRAMQRVSDLLQIMEQDLQRYSKVVCSIEQVELELS